MLDSNDAADLLGKAVKIIAFIVLTLLFSVLVCSSAIWYKLGQDSVTKDGVSNERSK